MAASDTMIANQTACTSSLIHYVEGTEEQALDYCRALCVVLADWDRRVPHVVSRSALGKLRMLRRHQLLGATWFTNETGLRTSSAVIYAPDRFDPSDHPMCRCVIVRPVRDFSGITQEVTDQVSAAGVYPDQLRTRIRDRLACAGVSNIMPLGECDRAYAGIPHDGLRSLSELVNWTNA
jgi:hypothetical protein